MTDEIGKVCLECGVWKEVSDFSPQARGRLGVRSRCRECLAARARRYRAANPEVARASTRRWHATNPSYRSTWNDNNRDRISDNYRAWRLANLDKVRAKVRRRRAQLSALPAEVYAVSEILKRDMKDGVVYCAICGLELSSYDVVHVDHLIPLSVDIGALIEYGLSEHPGDVLANVALAHASCNCSK